MPEYKTIDYHIFDDMPVSTNYYTRYYNSNESSTTSSSCYNEYMMDYEWGTGATVTGTWANRTRIDQKKILQQIIQQRSAPVVIVRRGLGVDLPRPKEIKEQRARDSLRRIIGVEAFNRFLRRGFVSVTVASGITYLLYGGTRQTVAIKDGKVIEHLCVVLSYEFADTDFLITRYILLLNDEQTFRALANISKVSANYNVATNSYVTQDFSNKNLVDIAKQVRAIAA